MTAFRAILFNIFLIFGSLFLSIILCWAWFLPTDKCASVVGDIYGGYITLIEKYILGLHVEMKGLEHLPKDGRFIIAAKHQSACETLKIPFSRKLGYPIIILKKELTFLPFWGIYPIRMGSVAIDRKSGAKAFAQMAEGCKKALSRGRPISIFPQGTRVAPGKRVEYKAGLAKLYKDLQVPVVPAALNTGVFWGKNKFWKKGGNATIEFFPPIPAGTPPLKMMEMLEKTLEEESDRLTIEVGGPALEIAS